MATQTAKSKPRKTRAKPGRPSLYTRARHRAIIADLENGASRTTAAELNGITLGTLTEWAGSPPEWKGSKPEFSRDVREAIAKCKRQAQHTIKAAMLTGDVNAAFRYLAYQEKNEWADTKGDITVNVSVSVEEVAARLAKDLNLDPDDVIAEAEHILELARRAA